MRSLLLCCLLSAAAVSASAVPSPDDGPASPAFEAAYLAAQAQAGKALVAAGPVEPEKTIAALKLKATTDGDKARLARLTKTLAELEKLREPIAAAAGASKDEILEMSYAAKVTRYAKELKADSTAALETRRKLLREKGGKTAAGPNGKPGEAVGPAPTEAVQRRLDAAADRARGMDTARARGMAAAFDQRGDAGAIGSGATPASRALPMGKAGPETPLRAGEFAVGQHLKTGDVPGAHGQPAEPAKPEETGWWAKTKSALTTPLHGAEEAYHEFSERHMADAKAREEQGARRLEQGGAANTILAGWDATVSFGHRVVAGDKKAVTAVAVGAAVVVGAVVAAPVLAAGSVAAGIGIAVEAGVAGLTTYNVVKGTAALARDPNALNAGMLVLNFAPVPYLGKIAHAAGSVAEKGVVALRSASTDSKLLAGAFSGMVAIAEKVGQKEVEVMAKSAVHDMAHVAGHQATHAMVHTAAATLEAPAVH